MKPYRSKKYTKWVKSLPCFYSGHPADDPHHIIGYGMGGMATKASDMFCLPVSRSIHNDIHRNHKEFEEKYSPQIFAVQDTWQKAVKEGLLTGDEIRGEILSQVLNVDEKERLMQVSYLID